MYSTTNTSQILMNNEHPWKEVSYAHQQPLYRVVNDDYKPKKRHYRDNKPKSLHRPPYTPPHMYSKTKNNTSSFDSICDDASITTKDDSIKSLSSRMDNLDIKQKGICQIDSISVTDYDILSAIRNDDIDRIQYLYSQEPDITRYNTHIPMCSGVRVLQYLVENGADIHEDDDAVLCWCSEKGYLDVVMYLVENGANIHARREHPFVFAANNGHLNIVKCLVDKGADIHIRDDEALFRAVWWNKPDMVEYLISIGLTPYGWSSDGSNYAWIQKHADEPCVKILNQYFHIL